MIDPTESRRTRFFLAASRGWGFVTLFTIVALLVLGGLVTSFRAGMTDPVWPTEPWFLAVNGEVWQEQKAGFLIEHSHRAAGFVVGACVSILALLAWGTHRRGWVALLGVAAVLALLGVYGQFHREMGEAWKARLAGADLVWPRGSAMACGGAAAIVLGLGAVSATSSGRGRWVPFTASLGLVAVMVQGLLGGFRVFLDQLMGTELAAIHGTFAQVVTCLLMTVVVVAGTPRRPLTAEDRARLGWLSLVVVLGIFVQLVWGVLVRHTGTGLSQRLHVLTAFAVAGLIGWQIVRTTATPTGRKALGFLAYHLLALLALQVLLGVEAWLGKFAAVGVNASVLPDQRPVTIGLAAIRTAHVLIGTGLLAAVVGFALRVWRAPLLEPTGEPLARA